MNAQPVQPAVKSGKITLDNFVKGLAPLAGAFTDSNTHNYGDKDYLGSYTTGCNPYRFPNCLAPAAQKTTVETGVSKITDTPRNFVTKDGTTGYMIGSGDGTNANSVKLYKITGAGFTAITDNSPTTPTFPHVITGAKNGYDLKIVTLVTGGTAKDFLIYTWDDGTATGRKCGLWDFSTNWTSSNLADDSWATLSGVSTEPVSQLAIEQGADGNYYITAGNKIDKIIAANAVASAFSAAAETLPGNYIGTTIRDHDGTLAIGASPKQCIVADASVNGAAKVFFWDYVNSTFVNIKPVGDNYIGDLEDKNGILYAFCGKRDGYCKLKEFDGQRFKTLCEFLGTVPWHNNPDVYRNMLIWTANLQVMSYGRPDESFPEAFNILDNFGGSGFAKPLYAVSGYDYHVSGVAKWARALGTGSDSQGSVAATGFIHLPRKSTIYAVKFYFNQLATGAYAVAEYVANKGGAPTAFAQDSGVISYALDGNITEKTFSQNIMDVDDFLPYLNYPNGSTGGCVAINRIEIFYSETNKL